jgi:hypothetical protein
MSYRARIQRLEQSLHTGEDQATDAELAAFVHGQIRAHLAVAAVELGIPAGAFALAARRLLERRPGNVFLEAATELTDNGEPPTAEHVETARGALLEIVGGTDQ